MTEPARAGAVERLALGVAPLAAAWLLRPAATAPSTTVVGVAAVAAAVGLVLALRALRRPSTWIASTLSTGLALLSAVSLVAAARGGVEAVAGLARVTATAFAWGTALRLGWAVVDAILGYFGPSAAVAQVALRESLRLRFVAPLFGVCVLALAALPEVLGSGQSAAARTQQVLQYGLAAAWLASALAVAVGACWTVAEDRAAQRVSLIATKPFSRGRYLLGKAIGVLAAPLVAVAVSVAGLHAWASYAALPEGIAARAAYRDDVLRARRTAALRPPAEALASLRREARAGAERMARSDPDAFAREGEAPGEALAMRALSSYHTLRLGEPRRFVATDLDPAGGALTLRVLPRSGGGDAGLGPPALRLELRTDPGGPAEAARTLELRADQPRVVALEGVPIAANGTVTVELTLRDGAPVTLAPGAGFEVRQDASGLGGNLARAAAVLGLRLVPIAALGLFLAAFTSFPVALVGALTAILATGLAGSLGRGDAAWVLRPLVRFWELGPIEAASLGQLVPWSHVVEAALGFALLLGGAALAAGWAILERREQAGSLS